MSQEEILSDFPAIPHAYAGCFVRRDIEDFFNLLKIAFDNIFVHPIIEWSSGNPMYANPQFKRLLTPEQEILNGKYVYCINYTHLQASRADMSERVLKFILDHDDGCAFLTFYDSCMLFERLRMQPQITGFYHRNLRQFIPEEFYVWLHVPRTRNLNDALFRRTFHSMLERKIQGENEWSRWENQTLPMIGLELHPKNAANNRFWTLDNLQMIDKEMMKSKNDWKRV